MLTCFDLQPSDMMHDQNMSKNVIIKTLYIVDPGFYGILFAFTIYEAMRVSSDDEALVGVKGQRWLLAHVSYSFLQSCPRSDR